MPAQNNRRKPSTKPVHFGQTFGVTPNPNATRPATVAAIGNPYGNMRGPAVAPHGVAGSTGIGNGHQIRLQLRHGRQSGLRRHSRRHRYGQQRATYANGKVASAGIPTVTRQPSRPAGSSCATGPPTLKSFRNRSVQYTSEARQLKIQGDVVLRVTFTACGQVVVQGVVHGLGHGLDEEARRVAQQIRFRPATRNGQAVDMTTNITITFQLA